VLLPGASLQEAREVAERVRRGMANAPIAVDKDRLHQITISVGVSGIPSMSADADDSVPV
jgi:PleD family two-component response regulator